MVPHIDALGSIYIYDHAGNLTEKQDPVETHYYGYDAAGQMESVEVPAGLVEMTYVAARPTVALFDM